MPTVRPLTSTRYWVDENGDIRKGGVPADEVESVLTQIKEFWKRPLRVLHECNYKGNRADGFGIARRWG